MSINKEFKEKYNALITREKKAEGWLNDSKRTEKELDKWMPKFTEIIIELSSMINQYKKLTGKDMTKELALNGFENKL